MKRALLVSPLLAVLASASEASEPPHKQPGISDNSFLLEESYNQDWGVVQHISSFTRARSGDWAYTFTQEWPVRGITHQLSYTLPFQGVDAGSGRSHGLGDVALNYRYQLVGDGEARFACAPRISLFLPTGDSFKGLGQGGVGIQTDVPLSWVIAPFLVTHLNAGVTRVASARSPEGARASLSSFNLGESLIWLVHPRFNVMLEAAWTRSDSVAGHNRSAASTSFLISPGIRWAFNFKSGLQIVPGLARPLGVGGSRGQRLLLAYLSFEHPFKRKPSRS